MPRIMYTLLLLLPAGAGVAQTTPDVDEQGEPELRRYSVELIVFAYAEDVATGSELFLPEVVEVEAPALIGDREGFWSAEGPIPDDSMAGDGETVLDETAPDQESGAGEAPPEFFDEFGRRVNEYGERIDDAGNVIVGFDPYALTVFAEDELTMLDTWDRLDRLDAYEPLLHVGWAQPGLPEEETEAIPLEDFESPVAGLDGAFTLYLSRYLHLVVDLELAAERGRDIDGDGIVDEMPDDSSRDLSYEETVALYGRAGRRETASPLPGQPMTGRLFADDEYADEMSPAAALKVLPLKYSINENRIVNSGDVRYFDHPKFGVVAKIERVELPDPAEAGDDTDVLLPVTAR